MTQSLLKPYKKEFQFELVGKVEMAVWAKLCMSRVWEFYQGVYDKEGWECQKEMWFGQCRS